MQPITDKARDVQRWPWQRPWPYLAVLGIGSFGVALYLVSGDGLLVAVACGAGLAVLLYVFFAQRERVQIARSGGTYLGPLLRDWVQLAGCLFFCVIGLLALYSTGGDLGLLAAFVFFALCALVNAVTVSAKLRARRFRASRVEVAQGVPIRGGNGYLAMLGVGLTVVAVTIFIAPWPWVAKACAAVMGAAGLCLLGAIATGLLRRRFVQFDPAGLTVGTIGFEYLITWDNILSVTTFEYVGNLFVGIDIERPVDVAVTPAARTQRALRQFDRTRRSMGIEVALLPMHFGLEPAVLAAAIATHLADARSRSTAQFDRLALPGSA